MRNTIRVALLAVVAVCSIAAIKGNWVATVSESDLSHTVGNPDAPVKLTEYISYTCPHCGEFARTGGDALTFAYIPSGNVQVETRHYIRDEVDLTAALLAWCGDAEDFQRNQSMIFHAQPDFLKEIRKSTEAQRARWETTPKSAGRRAIARDMGFYDLFRERYSTPQIDRCLADDALADRLESATEDYRAEPGVTGTPSFTINGVLLAGTYNWDMLAPQIDARLPAGAQLAKAPEPTD